MKHSINISAFGLLKSMTSLIPVIVTGHILRCDVIMDRIESIQIVTTTRQLFTDDPPLQLSVQAFDTKGTFHLANYIRTLFCK